MILLQKQLPTKKTPRIESTISRCIKFLRTIDLQLRPLLLKQPKEPPWFLQHSSFISSMVNMPKTITPATIYQQAFKATFDFFTKQNWNFLYTDGSKSLNFTTFAVIQQNNKIIKCGHIDNHCSNFTAEALAILIGTQVATKGDSKYIICTDSLSTILATQNTKHDSPLINNIRNNLIANQNKIKLMWVPSHVGIPGNEYADVSANDAKNRPLKNFSTWERRDITNAIYSNLEVFHKRKWDEYQHCYKNINSHGVKPLYPNSCSRFKTNIITRLRIGHSKLSHQHLIDNKPAPQCPTCNTQINIAHILNECTAYHNSRIKIFGSNIPTELLKDTSNNNINLICKFLIENNLKNLI